ncbi:hypothetical protein CEUSTIGMA_g446.t1 [Chlamydomonas eustigma]|uniref:SnoaL-like domain-containing protein n=1 Tax=Chlamydomonas eustigma TaxID=1157962 RepID=A0A250WQ70_9CHLO|nr:hypothetical protein CEUSTIGMA_g446.t1 [Chlamydomonas eustigma]|eukprot:GAX72994.1 hypothetical protein CEUSTIGMA_g446.t1 [Chlamydomonas eustigma]
MNRTSNSNCTTSRYRLPCQTVSHRLPRPFSYSTTSVQVSAVTNRTARTVILEYYEAYNKGDFTTLGDMFSEDVSYHDMIYEQPFVGRLQVLDYLRKVRDILTSDIKIVVEDATDGDPRRVGVMWHVESSNGAMMPFSRGCSFYTLDTEGKILQSRDLVESPVKPGSLTLNALAAVTPIFRALNLPA